MVLIFSRAGSVPYSSFLNVCQHLVIISLFRRLRRSISFEGESKKKDRVPRTPLLLSKTNSSGKPDAGCLGKASCYMATLKRVFLNVGFVGKIL